MPTTLTSIRSESPVLAGDPQLLGVFLWAAVSFQREQKGDDDHSAQLAGVS